MENNTSRFRKWFDLIIVMTDGRNHTARELSAVLGTTTRNLYYVLRVLREVGFDIVHEGKSYYINPRSPFLQPLINSLNLTSDEAAYLYRMLLSESSDSPQASMLRRKLGRYYDLRHLSDARLLERQHANIARLEQAMAERRVAILHDYSSPHSNSRTDRVVEPFLFLGDKSDVRAYEIKSHQNKTFKIARIGWVEVVDAPWFNASCHREVYTDMFMFSGEETHHVRLRFSLLARHLMLEEYPHAAAYIRREDKTHWIFETDVVSYVGLSRFVLGLYDEIEVLDDDGFRAFLNKRIEKMVHSIGIDGKN